MVNLPTRTPLSFVYFGAAGVAAYFASDVEALRWLAFAASAMFVARGPLLYVRDFITGSLDDIRGDLGKLLGVIVLVTIGGEWVAYGFACYWMLVFVAAL